MKINKCFVKNYSRDLTTASNNVDVEKLKSQVTAKLLWIIIIKRSSYKKFWFFTVPKKFWQNIHSFQNQKVKKSIKTVPQENNNNFINCM